MPHLLSFLITLVASTLKTMSLFSLDDTAIKAEYALIIEALKKTGYNKTKAAQLLGVDRKTLYRKITSYERSQQIDNEQKVA